MRKRMMRSLSLGLMVLGGVVAIGCDSGEGLEEDSRALLASPALIDPSASIGTLDLEPTGGSTFDGAGGFLAAKTHTCKTGGSRDDCAAFNAACKKFTGYDSSSSTGDNLSAVTYTCSCDGPQVASSDFCDQKIKEAQQ